MDHVNDGKQKANKIIQDLITVDRESVSCLEETHDNLQTMNNFLTEMSQKFASSASIANYSIKSTYDMTGYQTIRNEVYAETIEEIKNRMLEGENLNEEEREILYMHLQNKLTAEDLDKINKTKDYLLYDNEKLKTYINETVLATESSLESQIILLEEYLFTGNMKPSELDEDTGERVALRSYLDALKNYHASINEVKNDLNWKTEKTDPLFARVEYIEFTFDGSNQFSGHGNLDTQIAISYEQENNQSENRQEFLDLEPQFEGAYPVLGYHNVSNIEYYYGQDAVTNRMNVEEDRLKDDMRTMNGEYIGSELLGLGIGMARNAVSIPANAFLSYAENLSTKHEMKDDLKWFEIKKPANQFKLEIKVNDRASLETSNVRHAELYPTVETYNMLERWEAIHQEEKKFPYDAEAINNHDWSKLYKLFHEDTGSGETISLNEYDLELYNYMLDGTIPEDEEGNNRNSTIEKIERENE